jgi:hypothetical protein
MKLLSGLEYRIQNTAKEERFWRWLAEFYDREEKYDKEHPRTPTIPTIEEIFDSQWTCSDCQVTVCRQNSRLLDYAIYGHIQHFHDPSGFNSPKSRVRSLKVSIGESHLKQGWFLKN